MEKVIKTFKILVTELVFFCERSDKRLHASMSALGMRRHMRVWQLCSKDLIVCGL